MGLARLLIGNGPVFHGYGFGASGTFVGELCFATAMAGYQEILTDPSYYGQILCFTFPHIGNTGANEVDLESQHHGAGAFITASMPTIPSNYRSSMSLDAFAHSRNMIGMAGIDTRALTQMICQHGDLPALITHDNTRPLESLKEQLANWPGLTYQDLARSVTCQEPYTFAQGLEGCVVVVDFGVKQAILTCLKTCGFTVVVVPATASAEVIAQYKPCGVVLSNGPGDPRTTLNYSRPMIEHLIENNIPIFGICLGHQLLALVLGGKVEKMHTGHRGVNHPVKDIVHDRVIITTMNHGYAVDAHTLPATIEQTHISLFDGTNCGFRLTHKPILAVQFHPEASAGVHDAHFLFESFKALTHA